MTPSTDSPASCSRTAAHRPPPTLNEKATPRT